MIINPNGSGGIWTPVSIQRSCMHHRRERTVPSTPARVGKLPGAEPGSRFTALFERLAIDWLKVARQKAVAEPLPLSWDEIDGIMDRAVQRGLKRRKAEPVKHLGVEEQAFRKGHRYLTLVNDLDRRRVWYGMVCRRRPTAVELGWLLADIDG